MVASKQVVIELEPLIWLVKIFFDSFGLGFLNSTGGCYKRPSQSGQSNLLKFEGIL